MGDEVRDTQHLYQPRGKGWCLRIRTPKALVGQDNPLTGSKFGSEIRMGLGTSKLPEARDKRDMILGELRKLQAEREGASLSSMQEAAELAKAYREARADGDLMLEVGVEETAYLTAEKIAATKGADAAKAWHTVATDQGLPVSVALEQWQAEADVAEKTRYEQRKTVEAFIEFCGDCLVQDVNRRLAGKFVSEVLSKARNKSGTGNASPATIKKKLSALSEMWTFLRRRGHVEDNPWRDQGVKVKHEPQKRAYTWAELHRVMTHPKMDRTLRDAVTVAVYTGMRAQEIGKLTVGDVEAGGVNVRNGKTKNAKRWVPLAGPAKEVIERRSQGKPSDSYIFDDITEGPYEDRFFYVKKKYGRVRDQIFGKGSGKEIDFHSFRRVYAWAGEQVTDTVLLARLMGHSAPTLATSHYSAGAFRERLEKAQGEIAELIQGRLGSVSDRKSFDEWVSDSLATTPNA